MDHHFFQSMLDCLQIEESSFLLFLLDCFFVHVLYIFMNFLRTIVHAFLHSKADY